MFIRKVSAIAGIIYCLLLQEVVIFGLFVYDRIKYESLHSLFKILIL